MRGGKRIGAGRKKLPEEEKLVPKIIYLSQLDWMWIALQKLSKGRVIHNLIKKERG